ncbi:hypothetical protein [Halomonas cupida]|uniref:hypothetical protein n=1 Tax=Halomonas cupida TaxID=44933 RepID=UPI003A8D5782
MNYRVDIIGWYDWRRRRFIHCCRCGGRVGVVAKMAEKMPDVMGGLKIEKPFNDSVVEVIQASRKVDAIPSSARLSRQFSALEADA